jgi:RNA polymerase sigma-70 factor (ECF subfamily)
MTDWSQLVQQHGPMVWRSIRRLVGNEADGADCFQRTFLSAWELSRRETVRNWPGLLQRLATSRALECLRQRRRDANRLTALAKRSAVDGRLIGPLQAAQERELAEHLRVVLAEIDQRQAEVFCLACLDGLSYQQIADELGVTVNHVGVLLNRARSSLRERLKAFSVGPPPVVRPREEV